MRVAVVLCKSAFIDTTAICAGAVSSEARVACAGKGASRVKTCSMNGTVVSIH